MLSAKQGSHWYHFYNVFGMTRPGIDPTLTYRTRSGRSTTWAAAYVPKNLLVGLRKVRRLISRTYMFIGG